jgi:hypothetical protein
MKIVQANIGNWYVQCLPEDGARISVLRYEGQDLLTANPSSFKAPDKFHGEYEVRPVYGYDDCFPTVESCLSPDKSIEYRDHGELCWLGWKVQIEGNNLICSTDCLNPNVTFKRILEFAGNKLRWSFEVVNNLNKKITFLHVMHPLLPLDQIQSVELPEFSKCVDDTNSIDLSLDNVQQIRDHLFAIQKGSYEMLFMREIYAGSVVLGFKKNLFLQISFDSKLFPTIGIWWNNAGYPEEEGLKRNECAFEPIPGTCSNLSVSFKDGTYLSVERGKVFSWEIEWEIEKR